MYSHILGNSRIGPNRDLKFAIENFWKLNSSENEANLIETKNFIYNLNWNNQINLGLNYINVGDFSYYDHILTNLIYLGCIPKRFNFNSKNISLKNYFELCRGNSKELPMEMTKWFNTNYHYLIPEYSINVDFSIKNNWLFDDIKKAKSLNYPIKVSIIGPISLLKLGKIKDFKLKNRLLILPDLITSYLDLINKINSFKINLIQIEEPVLVTDLSNNWYNCFKSVYTLFSKYFNNLILTTYFGEIKNYFNFILSLKTLGLHLDINVNDININYLIKFNNKNIISLGIIDGRNIWKNDLEKSYYMIFKFIKNYKNIFISTTSSFLHIPINLDKELIINKNIKYWLSFGLQKIKELILLKNILIKNYKFLPRDFIKNVYFVENKKKSTLIYNNKIQNLIKNLTNDDFSPKINYNLRKYYQKLYFNLPNIVTTTIGSFPQTKQIRKIRFNYKKNLITKPVYEDFIKNEIKFCLKKQIKFDLDVLVHGEFERNDMVEYFAELLNGYLITNYAWVQSYGSRCVKPPIIYGDIFMSKFMTLKWIIYSQSLTKKYIKAMLTGPLTMLKWSFCRDDQPLYITALQIAIAIKQEVLKLEINNIKIIQIDEPALRELMPLKQKDFSNYFNWASKVFSLTYNKTRADTQIHTHLCYSNFKDIFYFIKKLDIDVISIEASRSNMNILSNISNYFNEIGVGVYDIHAKRRLDYNNLYYMIKLIINHLSIDSIWINPDCGLKTRSWKDIDLPLKYMVVLSKTIRKLFNL